MPWLQRSNLPGLESVTGRLPRRWRSFRPCGSRNDTNFLRLTVKLAYFSALLFVGTRCGMRTLHHRKPAFIRFAAALLDAGFGFSIQGLCTGGRTTAFAEIGHNNFVALITATNLITIVYFNAARRFDPLPRQMYLAASDGFAGKRPGFKKTCRP